MSNKCNNCEREYDVPELVVRVRDTAVAHICADCLTSVLTMKVVFKRAKGSEPFAFEQYLPVESEKN